jgi:hypothetical protein
MDSRRRLSVVLAGIIIGSAAVGVSHATAGPEWIAATEAVAAEQKAAKVTLTPTRPSAPIGEDLIYDIVGPNTAP